jgi:predicted acylesterase/phospholipase RssA
VGVLCRFSPTRLILSATFSFVVAKLASSLDANRPILFRTYEHHSNVECKIWEAARATTSNPTFFEAIEIGDLKIRYIDGGVGLNNPVDQLRKEAETQFDGCGVACIVSIGCGQKPVIKIPKWSLFSRADIPTSVTKACIELVTDSEEVHDRTEAYFTGRPGVYFRFSVNKDTGVGMQDWKKLEEVAATTANYMEATNIQNQFRQVTQSLSSREVRTGVSDISRDNRLSLHNRLSYFELRYAIASKNCITARTY